MKIKICGIRSLEAAQAAEKYGADFIGFIFYDKSRRFIEPLEAAKIAAGVKIKKVGVFVNADFHFAVETAKSCRLDLIQLHGRETIDYAKNLKDTTHLPIIKAFRFGDDFNADAANDYPADFILIDSGGKEQFGGTGQRFAWQEAQAAVKNLKKPFFVAGGINIDNALLAAEIFQPYALDVSGGVEGADGEKDINKIKNFLKAVNLWKIF